MRTLRLQRSVAGIAEWLHHLSPHGLSLCDGISSRPSSQVERNVWQYPVSDSLSPLPKGDESLMRPCQGTGLRSSFGISWQGKDALQPFLWSLAGVQGLGSKVVCLLGCSCPCHRITEGIVFLGAVWSFALNSLSFPGHILTHSLPRCSSGQTGVQSTQQRSLLSFCSLLFSRALFPSFHRQLKGVSISMERNREDYTYPSIPEKKFHNDFNENSADLSLLCD